MDKDDWGIRFGFVDPKSIVPLSEVQQNLFVRFDNSKYTRLLDAMDRINTHWGREMVRSGVSGYERPWGMRRARVLDRFG